MTNQTPFDKKANIHGVCMRKKSGGQHPIFLEVITSYYLQVTKTLKHGIKSKKLSK
jgi:hypothetical protein